MRRGQYIDLTGLDLDRKGGRTMSDEKRITYLGTVDLSDDDEKTVALNIPTNGDLDPDAIKAAIACAEEEKAQRKRAESEKLRSQFLGERK
jgi:hypothetical protein